MTSQNSGPRYGNEINAWWVLHGETPEKDFLAICNEKLKIDAGLNLPRPDNSFCPALLIDGRAAELKTQVTPFFTAKRYGLDPRWIFTFDREDYERYRNHCPDVDIYFWLDWQLLKWNNTDLEYLAGIYRLPFRKIIELITDVPEHIFRVGKKPKAKKPKSFFLLDIRQLELLFQTECRHS